MESPTDFRDSPPPIGYSCSVTRNIRILIAFFLFTSCSSRLRGETPPAFDSTDEHALELALRAIKMTPADLSFTKTNAESELILQKAQMFLQQPLELPAYGQYMMSKLKAVDSLFSLTWLAGEQVEKMGGAISIESEIITVDPSFQSNLPPAAARAVKIITDESSFVNQCLSMVLPSDRVDAFSAFAVDTFDLDKDKAEIESWEKLGIKTDGIRSLLRRSDNLELQDNEMANSILKASDEFTGNNIYFNQPLFYFAFAQLAAAVDQAIAILQAAKDDPAMHQEFNTRPTPLSAKLSSAGRDTTSIPTKPFSSSTPAAMTLI